jgi:hypothetical protein
MVIGEIHNGILTRIGSGYTKEWSAFEMELCDLRGFHVGTTREFCTDYYSGLVDETDTIKNVLLTLSVKPGNILPDHLERFRGGWACGAEAIVYSAQVICWEVIGE